MWQCLILEAEMLQVTFQVWKSFCELGNPGIGYADMLEIQSGMGCRSIVWEGSLDPLLNFAESCYYLVLFWLLHDK